eukprot:1314811-Heterocapsa_arctica.AAC.1
MLPASVTVAPPTSFINSLFSSFSPPQDALQLVVLREVDDIGLPLVHRRDVLWHFLNFINDGLCSMSACGQVPCIQVLLERVVLPAVPFAAAAAL